MFANMTCMILIEANECKVDRNWKMPTDISMENGAPKLEEIPLLIQKHKTANNEP